jgi:Na+-transporting methylmalonyl-CoA/oxaloacetate decarboxylase beta subunit
MERFKLKKQKFRKLIIVLTAISIILTLISVSFDSILRLYFSIKLNFETAKGDSIGIIGGADGPTSVFVSSKPSPYVVAAIFLLLSIAGVLYLFFTRKTRK